MIAENPKKNKLLPEDAADKREIPVTERVRVFAGEQFESVASTSIWL